ncbi:MAG: hypothetical protein ACD_62C00096G0002 [uncultured bacterium]|nr:MAG: hypothetical protein ACD_62C00096G0002 [uncultured bacterium]
MTAATFKTGQAKPGIATHKESLHCLVPDGTVESQLGLVTTGVFFLKRPEMIIKNLE